ncbi:MAG: leucine-rich repeat domain-containing protein [Clostridia bacterium]|nr:leucine-rich repeat domain-containing protein [Clostridia bacterium]
MKNKMKKMLSVTLAVIMAMSVMTVGASAWLFDDEEIFTSDEVTIDHIIYFTDSETMTAGVVDYERDEENLSLTAAEITIPETIEVNGAKYTVDYIGHRAFESSSTLRKITIPETVDYISDYAFCSAEYLETVIIPETTEFEYFGSYVFDSTPVLGYFAENSEDGAVILGTNVLYAYVGTESSYTVPEEITIIADYCFFLSGVEEIILNDSITEIPDFTFSSCRNLKEITIPESVEYIGAYAFSDCTSLEKVELGDSLCVIGEMAFEGTQVKELYLGDSLEYTSGAFAGCNTLEKFVISENNGYYMDGDALCYHYEFEDPIEADISEDTVLSFDSLEYYLITSENTSYTVPEKITTINNYAFFNCKQIKEIKLTSPVDIFSWAFENSGIETVDFSMVLFIGYAAFRGCKNLKSLDLSEVYYIDDSAFEDCTALTEVTFGNALEGIGYRAFADTGLRTVDVVGDYCWVYEGAFADCSELTRIDFNAGVEFIDYYVASSCPKLERVYISETVTTIEDDAFANNENIVFEVIKYSDGCDFVEKMGYEYEIVGKLSFFTRVARFFTELFDKLFGWLMFM